MKKNWDDVVIYNVGFIVCTRLENGKMNQREIHQTLVLPMELSESEIKLLILEKFDYSLEVIYVEELYSALIKKK